jgi:tight adherence protein B
VVQRLGVLLAAGVAPVSGWGYVAEGVRGRIAEDVRAVATAAASGESIGLAIAAVSGADRQAWRGLAAAWLVATEAGAPLAATLAELASCLRSLAQNQRDLQTALAAPAATARMVMALPVVGILFGFALGFDSIGILFTTPPGLVCLGLGSALMLLAFFWNRRLVSRARPTDLTPGLALDLMAIAVSGGASIPRARRAVADARERCGLRLADSDEALDDVLDLSRRAGIPAAALLRSEATELRRVARSEGERKAATLSVTLMLPLGLCVLPAFMLLGVAPLLIAVISSTVSGL